MSKYKQVEERIRQLVPRLKELSFGCVVGNNSQNTDNPFYAQRFIKKDQKKGKLTYIRYKKGYGISETFADLEKKDKGFDVIGHPIRLEDVLEAFNNQEFYSEALEAIPCSGDFKQIHLHHYNECGRDSGKIPWKYGKPFSQQSEETKDFIASLILKIK